MTHQEAIIAFSQSEKIKTGLIWLSQAIESSTSFQPADISGAEKTVQILSQMLLSELHVAQRMCPTMEWTEIQRHTDTAVVMIQSGVMRDAVFNLTKALTEVTGIAQKAMIFLKERQLL